MDQHLKELEFHMINTMVLEEGRKRKNQRRLMKKIKKRFTQMIKKILTMNQRNDYYFSIK